MQFGLFGSAAARRPTSADAGEFYSSEALRELIKYNLEAEALGFRGTFVVEHHFPGYGQVSATLNLLTWRGPRTTTLRLGTAVIVLPWHNPVLLAEQVATLDLLSGGRLDFGVGSGYRYNEFAGFRVPIDQANAPFGQCLAARPVRASKNLGPHPPTRQNAPPADLDGRRRRKLGAPGRRSQSQSAAR